jgi:ParB-like chromosome segregation protein Spo0J
MRSSVAGDGGGEGAMIPTDLTKLQPHSLANLFPAMTPEEFKALKEDIQTNGLRVPIVIYAGAILDGRHRYKAMVEIGRPLTPEKDVMEWKPTGTDTPTKYVVSQNVARRHLNESQRAIIAAELANGTHGGDRSKTPIDALTEDGAAKLLNVSEKSVQRAKKALANPRLADAVRKGTIKVSAANNFAESDKQDELLKANNNDIVKAVKALNTNTDPVATTLWNGLMSKFEKMKLDELEPTVRVLTDKLATYLKAQKEMATL